MPPHQRNLPHGAQGTGQVQQGPLRIGEEIKALNTSILLVTQKLNAMVRYEKILGRNLVVLSKKIKELQEGRQGTSTGAASLESELAEINRRLSENAEVMARLQSDVDYVKQNYAKLEQVSEMKYVVDSINPLDFVTVKDVREIVAGKKKKGA